MKTMRYLVLLSFVVCGLFLATSVYAEEGGKACGKNASMSQKKHEGSEKRMEDIYNKLNLTPEQKQSLEANKAKMKEARKASFEKMKGYREALRAELMKPTLDMAKINDIQSKLKALESEMADSRLNSILEVRKILNQEQFEKFNSELEKHKSGGHKWQKSGTKEE